MSVLTDLVARLRDAAGAGGSTGALAVIGGLLFVALVSAGAWYLVYLMSPRARVHALLESRADERAPSKWLNRIVGLLVVAAAVIAVNSYAGSSSACANCHTDRKQEKALATSAHKGVACMSCHGAGGPTGPVEQGVTYARWVGVYALSKEVPKPQPGSVGSSACQRCHSGLDRVAVRAGIRVRHSDFLDAGAECRDCHNAAAHPGAVRYDTRPTMNACLECHDGVKAPSACGTCHVRDVANTPVVDRGYTKLKTSGSPDACYTCHSETPCLRCHGIRMPHPAGWGPGETATGTHPRAGFADRDVCYRCHHAPGKPFVASQESCSCHGILGATHGGKPWVKEHGLQATGKKPGSNARCFDCHGDDLCDRCHTPEYRARYAPVPGTDTYRRDIPLDPSTQDW